MREVSPEKAAALFRNACSHAGEEQERFLARLLSRNAHTEFGERYGFGEIRCGKEYSRTVPLSDFSDYEDSISRIINGERNILTADPPVFYNISAGSTGEPKYIPLCREDVEMQHLYLDTTVRGILREALPECTEQELFGCIFSLNDFYLTEMPDGTMNGVRSGVSFRAAQQEGSFDASCFTAPEEVLFPEKLEDMLYVKVRFALENEHVTAIHGIFVHRAVGMFEYILRHWDDLLRDIECGTVGEGFRVNGAWREYLRNRLSPNPRRAARLRALDPASLRDGMLPKIWKELRYIQLISGSQFWPYCDKLTEFAGGIPVHSFAYSSSESNIGIAPRLGVPDEYVLLPDVCWFEFIPEEQMEDPKETLTLREAEAGKRYELVLTTLSGLYRYRMGDVVEVTGFYGEAPAIRICYRRNPVISLLDERMSAAQLENALRLFEESTGVPHGYCFAAGSYDGIRPKYILYLETAGRLPAEAPQVMDRCLCRSSFSYRSVREMNELDAAEVYPVPVGTFSEYQRICQKKGMRVEQAKPLTILTGRKLIDFLEAAGR